MPPTPVSSGFKNFSSVPRKSMAQGHRRGVGCYLLTGLCLLVLLRTCTSLAPASSDEEPLAWDDLMEEVEEMLWDKRHCGVEHALCSHNGTTRLVNESSPVFVGGLCSQCHCDDDCLRYGDCCLDKTQASWGVSSEGASERFNCRKTESMSSVGILMIDSCLAPYAGQPLERMCLQDVPREDYHYMLDVAVTSRVTNITYVNYYCALCNDDAYAIQNWTINIACKPGERPENITIAEFMGNATYYPGLRQWVRLVYKTDEAGKSRRERHICYTQIAEFLDAQRFGGRPCIYPKSECLKRFVGRNKCQEQVRHCDPDWPDSTDFEKCERYSLMVAYTDSRKRMTYYKNPHCARCNFANASVGELQCLPPTRWSQCVNGFRQTSPPRLPPSFSVLMDFRGGRCDEATELWDPVLEICHKIHCGHLFRLVAGRCERDVEAYESLSNSSLLDSSCPKRLLNLTEYVPRGDGSIFVNASKKVYAKGEFEVRNDTHVLICHDVSHYAEAFGAVHQYLTLVVLSVSLVALALHIAIYMLVPRHRNLPGKNLFSLSCCLFVAHVLFLTGTRETGVHGLCVFLSCSLHYFWLASFCWMNVMSVDVCRTFSSQLYRGDSDGGRTYLLYSLYAWTVPALVVSLALLLDWVDLLPDYRPEYATRLCWINNRHGLALFFLLPVGAIVQENLVLFLISTYGICKQMKAARYANVRSQSTREGRHGEKAPRRKSDALRDGVSRKTAQQTRRARKERGRLILYMKLGVIQGLTWLTGFIAAFADIPACWYPFTVLNGLQGAFIFIGFDMKRKVAEAVWEAVTGRPWIKKSSSKDTRTTTVGQSSNSHNRSSKSYSDSDGEALIKNTSEDPLVHENTTWDSNVSLTTLSKVTFKGSSAATKTWKSSSLSSDSPQRGQRSDRATGTGRGGAERLSNGDLRGGVVRGKFEDEGVSLSPVTSGPTAEAGEKKHH
ncbi:uncharacterized protein LOC119578707 isoform X3 [Penaeus monodon]|uniref:uncharacterized protein LOC119578707 isoform X3 n=1 Tax=Penaeus monodon TaxID=6687 RepID=UPI0018A73F2C|nr:uncharacterized protein LOC119578707 isoform X3 [Penaeus monodon]